VSALLDVHAPHHSPNSAKDFFFHLFTITIGLLIALGLEGLVERHHQHHLAHDAEVSMSAEIRSNAAGMAAMLATVHKHQDELKHDVQVLDLAATNQGKVPKDNHMAVSFNLSTFESVGWKTAQSTGALAYMPYDRASEFAGVYDAQSVVTASEEVAMRDAAISMAPFMDDDPTNKDLTPGEVAEIKKNIQIQQGQLLILSAMIQGLDSEYKQFLAAHPN